MRLKEFDDLLVCDMQSTDDTIAVATRCGARVMQVPFAPIAESVRQLALDAVETEWVLFVDADELVPSTLQAALALETIPHDVAAVRLRYDNIAFGVQLCHTLQSSAKYALLRTDLAHYGSDGRAHQPPSFDGPAIDAPAFTPSILHLSYRSVPQSMEKVLRYAQSDPRGDATLANPLTLPWEIFNEVLGGGAWRDGRAGVVVVTLNAIGRFYAAAIDWEQRGCVDPGWQPQARRLLVIGSWLRRSLMGTRNGMLRARWRRKSRSS